MAEAPLPDDLSLWPADAYELLGVNRSSSLQDLKRNYARLIRYYKPEHFPEHFQRIRNAYEQVQRYLIYFTSANSLSEYQFEETVNPIPRSDRTSLQNENPTPADESTLNDLRSAGFSRQGETVDSLWTLAIKGEEERAYRGLRELHELTPHRQSIVLRLYWLLTLNRNLDPNLVPADWLVGTLIENRLLGPASELYRREVQWFPEEAFSERFDKLLQSDANPKRLTEFLNWRWQAAIRIQRWDVIQEDREVLRPRMQFCDEEGWVELLLLVIHSCIWHDHPLAIELYESCRKEFESHNHLSLRHSSWFDRCEHLYRYVSTWQKLRKKAIPSVFTDIFHLKWTQSFDEMVPEFRKLLEAIHSAPPDWLKILDSVQSVAPVLFIEFGTFLENYESRFEMLVPHPGESPELIKSVDEAIKRFARLRYSELRVKLMEYCMREWFHPEWLQKWLRDRTVYIEVNSDPKNLTPTTFGKQLEKDLPLRYVCWAERLFWR